MSQESERVYTVNLGKVLLTPNNQRAKRAINMVKEFARRHMKRNKSKLKKNLAICFGLEELNILQEKYESE